jgi:SAM-dependent methyltransferase
MRGKCPICGSRPFEAFGGRQAARCRRCGGLERHRALASVSASLTAEGAGRRCLEAGPLNPMVFGGYLRARGWTYTSVDRWRGGNPNDARNVTFVDVVADLRNLEAFPDASFDLFITQHVIEEIDDFRAALREIARVLGANATALLEIPFDASRPDSVPQPPDRYGNVWRFGADLPEEVGRVFSTVERAPMTEGDYNGMLLICADSA